VILRKFRPAGNVVMWTVQQIHAHIAYSHTKNPDFLTRFIAAREKYPDIMTDGQVAEYANTNVSAGSDTTAIALRELVYRLLTNPDRYWVFMEELKAVLRARSQDDEAGYDRPITWAEGNGMPYFQALIKECLRVHPALGQLVPRDVPEGGIELCGKFLPAGTVVGCNAWTVHRDKNFYGEDADEFRPERWLDEDKERVRALENASFAFGGGPRVCIGKNIAMLEITKFIPEFFRRFEVQLVDQSRYKLRPGWLVVQEGLDVNLQRRDPRSLLV
jgi:cytochrome P450